MSSRKQIITEHRLIISWLDTQMKDVLAGVKTGDEATQEFGALVRAIDTGVMPSWYKQKKAIPKRDAYIQNEPNFELLKDAYRKGLEKVTPADTRATAERLMQYLAAVDIGNDDWLYWAQSSAGLR